MKKLLLAMIVSLGMSAHVAHAQAPAGSTGQCKDGTYTTAKSKRGACSGHGGVQTWMAAVAPATPAATPANPAPAASAVAPKANTMQPNAPRPATVDAMANKATPAAPATAPAPGGGPGMVWVNLPTKVYHCPGTRYYGTTKSGKYMSEADAKAMGARGDHNKTCTQ